MSPLAKSNLLGATWTLTDQGVVSLGTFLVSVLLARGLAPADFGVYALIYGTIMTFQLFSASIIFYPLSVRLDNTDELRRPQMIGASYFLTVFVSLGICVIVALIAITLGRMDLILPVSAFIVLGQLQEAGRRSLLATFRHRDAVPGDAMSYLGQVAAVFALARLDLLTLDNAIYAMALTSGVAAAVQTVQVKVRTPRPRDAWRVAVEFWSVGNWSLANGLVSAGRTQILPWLLAWMHGPVAVASFQAVFNVANLVNPILIGLCNLIPQTAARARQKGKHEAWLAARPFALIGIPPTFLYCIVALLAPGVILSFVYGIDSPYSELHWPLRLLIIAWMVGYSADMTCSYLHGIESARTAFHINALGVVTAAAFAIPLTGSLGLVGSCIALIIANAVRSAASQIFLARIIAHDRPRAV